MSDTLILKNINKTYCIGKSKYFNALSNINLSFSRTGLNAIIGKSGSGKSTLLNLICRIDNPTSGEIYLNTVRYKKKEHKLHNFYQNEVGIVFQNYHLLENETVLFNVALPLLIKGVKKKKAYSLAEDVLRFINIKDELFNKKASDLSGGEKQRVAIARALIKKPKILVCDEPTGALDSDNSILVMEELKKISERTLVIVVSHNLQLINKYANRIIELSDGKVINDYSNKVKKIGAKENVIESRPSGVWANKFGFSNFKKRLKRNLFVIASLSISLSMVMIIVGFINGKDKSIHNACYKQFDYGYGTISEEMVVSNTGLLKLTKSVRPELSDLTSNSGLTQKFNICPNFSTILPQNLKIYYDGLLLKDITYTPIYSVQEPYIDSSLISIGQLPKEDTLFECVINEKCYLLLKKKLKKDPLQETISLNHYFQSNYVNEYSETITDAFYYDINCKIVGVIKELDYLSTPKIYYSYIALENYMQEYVLDNLSTYLDNKITWYDRVMNAENYSSLTAYSYQLFLKDYRYRSDLINMKFIDSKYTYSSNSLIIGDSLTNFFNAAEYALFLFLGITLIGTVLILSIISFTNYSEDRKISAIFTSLGARTSDIENIYLNESLLSGTISLFISLICAYPLSILVNCLITKYVGLTNVVDIPYASFMRIPLFFPLMMFIGMILIIGVFTILPIKFSKSISLKEELQSND